MREMKFAAKRVTVVVAVMVLIALVLIALGRNAGGSAAEASIEKLSVIWPDVLALQEEDRILLAKLSLDCNLPLQP